MKVFKYFLICFAVSIFISSSLVHAFNREEDNDNGDSGWDETDIGLSDFSGLADEQRTKRVEIVDHAYELGKSVYQGRQEGIPKLSYCLTFDDQMKQIKRKTIKSYKNSTFSQLAINLYNCDTPGNHIKKDLPRYEFLHVLYYLDKRYKLNLKRE